MYCSGDAHRLDGHLEAVGRRGRRDAPASGAVGVAAVDRLEEVRLLGLGRQPVDGPAALEFDDDERQLGDDRQADRLGLERDARARELEVTPSAPAYEAPMAEQIAAISSSAWKVTTP